MSVQGRVFAELRHMIAVVSSGVRSRQVKSTDCLLLYASCTFLAMCLSVCVAVYLSVYLSICLSVYLSVYLFICLSVYRSEIDVT